MQVFDWGEAGKISGKIFNELNVLLGEGKSIQGSNDSEGCYIATAVYEDYDHPQVLKLRKFRDHHLRHTKYGRKLIKFYYQVGPKLACVPRRFPFIQNQLRKLFDRI